MKFDKSKVYTALNADEVKVGSRGCIADTIAGLKDRVENEDIHTLIDIKNEEYRWRFGADDGNPDYWNLFYLVEEPIGYRPYEDNNELQEDFGYLQNIWVKRKDTKNSYLITAFEVISGVYYVRVCDKVITLTELFEDYCSLAGKPLGKKIK